MRNYAINLKKGALILVAIMLLTIPNTAVYSTIGSYSTNSSSLIANSNSELTSASVDKDSSIWIGAVKVAAEAVALAYATGYALGTLAHHAYDSLGGSFQTELAMVDFAGYNPADFSKFDN